MDTKKRFALACAGAATMLVTSALAAAPASADTWTETTGPDNSNKTFADYLNAGEPLGPELQPTSTVEISCRIKGLVVGGNDWWYRIASAPWNNQFYASADGFYNNGATSGSLSGTPPVDTTIPTCEPDTNTGSPAGSSGTIINGIDVGTPQNERHQWGDCMVQDFNGGPHGWVMVDYTHGTNVVRNGMLSGWVKNGGGPGLGCALNEEYRFGNAQRQDFDKDLKSLWWYKHNPAASDSALAVRFTPLESTKLSSMLLSYYYHGDGIPVVVDWSYLEGDSSLMNALRARSGDSTSDTYESTPTEDGDVFWALGAFSIAKTPDGCFAIGDRYGFTPNKVANIPYIFSWADSLTGAASEYQIYASGC